MCAYSILCKTGAHFFKVTFTYIAIAIDIYYAAKFWFFLYVVGIYLFISSIQAPSLAHNMCFKKFILNVFLTFLLLSLMDIGFQLFLILSV